jgi:TetR/AcrR family transcriptional regulator, regulator of cefoperazone and chloramphenicol sensitivity
MIEQQDLSTKERIFCAAIKIIAQKGFIAATVREICQMAQAGNINAVNYYFGTKENLYKAILDKMFAAHQAHLAQYPVPATPLEHLETYIHSYCTMLYTGGEMARDLVKIFTAEMARPSKLLDKIVEKHTRPEALAIMASVRKLLGPAVPEDAVRDTCVSIGSQIIYYSYAWPVFSHVFPEHPGMEAYHEQLAEHIFHFSLGGIKAVKDHFERST